jgi:hypothetical protein
MTTEQIVRDQLQRATKDVVGGPDLEAVLQRGRSKRRRRRGLAGLMAVAVLGVGAAGIYAVAGGSNRTTVHDVPVAVAPAGPTDYVPGTDIDAHLAAIIASHFPTLPAPDDVYPSDSHTAGPIPDADFAAAEDWQATYTENGNQVLLITGLASEGSNDCAQCQEQQVAGGTLSTDLYQSTGDDGRTRWYFGTYFTRSDGTFANVWEIVTGGTQGAAEAQRHLSDDDLAALVQDRGLTFAGLGATAP